MDSYFRKEKYKIESKEEDKCKDSRRESRYREGAGKGRKEKYTCKVTVKAVKKKEESGKAVEPVVTPTTKVTPAPTTKTPSPSKAPSPSKTPSPSEDPKKLDLDESLRVLDIYNSSMTEMGKLLMGDEHGNLFPYLALEGKVANMNAQELYSWIQSEQTEVITSKSVESTEWLTTVEEIRKYTGLDFSGSSEGYLVLRLIGKDKKENYVVVSYEYVEPSEVEIEPRAFINEELTGGGSPHYFFQGTLPNTPENIKTIFNNTIVRFNNPDAVKSYEFIYPGDESWPVGDPAPEGSFYLKYEETGGNVKWLQMSYRQDYEHLYGGLKITNISGEGLLSYNIPEYAYSSQVIELHGIREFSTMNEQLAYYKTLTFDFGKENITYEIELREYDGIYIVMTDQDSGKSREMMFDYYEGLD